MLKLIVALFLVLCVAQSVQGKETFYGQFNPSPTKTLADFRIAFLNALTSHFSIASSRINIIVLMEDSQQAGLFGIQFEFTDGRTGQLLRADW